MTPTISKELQEQIEREAEGYSREQEADYSRRSVNAYIAGATAYAHYKERCNELERWKREAVVLLSPLLEYGQSREANIPLGASITAVILERAKRFEQAQKALEEVYAICEKADSAGWVTGITPEIKSTITPLLASWKEEGKDDITEICYECEEKPVYSDKLCKDCYYK